MRSICRSRGRICFKMGGPYSRRRFPAAVMGILPKVARSKFLRRKGIILRPCMGKSSMHTEIRSWRTPMQTCQFQAEANLFLRQCIISCGLTELTVCMPDICPAIPRHTAVFGCRNSMQLRSLIRSTSALQSRFLAGLRLASIWDNGNRRFSPAATDLQTHASRHVSLRGRRHFRGGGNVTQTIVSGRGLKAWQTGMSASLVNDWCWPSLGRGKDRQDRRGY